MNEPHKAMSWLTPDPTLDEDAVTRMFLQGRRGRRPVVVGGLLADLADG